MCCRRWKLSVMMLQNSTPAVYVQYKWFSVEINGMRHPPSPWDDTVIREKHINAVRLTQNKLPFCWMFVFCLLWAWLIPWWWLSPSKAAKLVSSCLSSLSLSLSLSLSECWLNQTKPVPGSLFVFWSDIPSAELSPRSDCVSACIQTLDWPGRDPRLNMKTEMKDGSARRMTRHPSWELDLTSLPKACTDNEPLRYYAPSETLLWVRGSVDNLIWNSLWFPQWALRQEHVILNNSKSRTDVPVLPPFLSMH